MLMFLEHYFEMSRYDAERALGIYKTFTKQTNSVVEFLSTARQYENATRLEIPKLKHAPTSLTSSLTEYLNDPDFEVNRRQYLAQQEGKRSGKNTSNGVTESSSKFSKTSVNKTVSNRDFPEPKAVQAAPPKPEAKGPAPDLIDFFASIETNQQPMASAPQQQQAQVPNFGVGPQYQQQQQLQQTGILPQQNTFFAQNGQQPQSQPQSGNSFGSSNPFGPPQAQQPAQQDFTGAGDGGYGQQLFQQPQDAFSSMPQNNGYQFSSQQDAFSGTPQSTGSQFSPQQDTFSGMMQNNTPQFQPPQQSFNTGPQSFNAGTQYLGSPQRSMTTGGSNPFRQSTMPTGASIPSFTSNPTVSSPQHNPSTNPFARNLTGQATGQMQSTPFGSQPTGGSPFTSPPPQQPQNTPFTSIPQPQQQQLIPQPMSPAKTGTNPFASTNTSPPNTNSPFAPTQPLTATPTGTTNPFRQSTFGNQQTGQGWQANQGTMGGFEQLPTMPVFPRPGQPLQQQQGTWPG